MRKTFISIQALFSRAFLSLREFLAGASMSWAAVPYTLKRRREMENLFMFQTFLNLHGSLPMPMRHRLVLLPYVVPQIMYWRRRFSLWDDSLEHADLKHIGH
jgi:hypothetical protein